MHLKIDVLELISSLCENKQVPFQRTLQGTLSDLPYIFILSKELIL